MIRVGNGERSQKEGVNQTECRSAGANGESEREDGSGGSDFIFGELAKAEHGVATERVEP